MIFSPLLLCFLIAPIQAGQETDIFLAIERGDSYPLEKTITDRTYIERVNLLGETPLIVAAKLNRSGIVRLLLAAGADIEARDEMGSTALFHAACENHFETVALLLEYGANIDIENKSGWTPLWAASCKMYRNIVRLLERVREFVKNGLKAFDSSIGAERVKQYLIWAIAYKKHQSYNVIKDLKPCWFARTNLLIRFYLHAAATSNGYVMHDIFPQLRGLLSTHKFSLIVLMTLSALISIPEMQLFAQQITTEFVVPKMLNI